MGPDRLAIDKTARDYLVALASSDASGAARLSVFRFDLARSRSLAFKDVVPASGRDLTVRSIAGESLLGTNRVGSEAVPWVATATVSVSGPNGNRVYAIQMSGESSAGTKVSTAIAR